MALDLVAGRASLEVRALSRTVLGWRTKRGWSLAELGELVGFSAANRPNVRIRIVPAAHGAHAGPAGPFTQLTFARYEPLVWVETENSSLIAEAKDAIDGYETVVRALEAQSLDEAESTALIVRLYEALQAAHDQAAAAETCSTESLVSG